MKPWSTARLANAINLDSGDALYILCGPGVQDRFVCADYRERSLETALWEHLRDSGFERVAFSRHGDPLYFMDEASAESAVPGGTASRAGRAAAGQSGPLGGGLPGGTASRAGRDAVGQSGPLGGGLSGSAASRAGVGQSGPLGGGLPARSAPPRRPPRMLDLSLVQTLNAFMRDTSVRSAVVILWTEDYLRHLQPAAHRELADYLGEWARSAASQRNVCVLVFAAPNLTDAIRKVVDVRDTDVLVSFLERQRVRRGRRSVGTVGLAERSEMARLVQVARLRHGLAVDWPNLDRLIAAMAARPGETVRNWHAALTRIASRGDALTGEILKAEQLIDGLPSGLSPWQELDKLVGMEPLRERLELFRAVAREPDGDSAGQAETLHLAFVGNPGTGKTTAARLVGEIYRDFGLLERGHLHAVRGSEIVAPYLGNTVAMTDAAVDNALDGVLFIDEAYAIANTREYGPEAINELVLRMEDERHRLAVIVAGYTEDMNMFLASNAGLISRFSRQNIIEFPDYTPEQLVEIAHGMLAERNLTISPELEPLLAEHIRRMYDRRNPKTWGNAREMRELASHLAARWALRTKRNRAEPLRPGDLPEEAA
ncbi:AAA family ATPase [Acrocarpospora macrocephala]|uniref:AAA family ATPase n=1 Tax=Acrocarpospora macrocephala TaxID=150177 RepID=UPI0012D2E94A|nr:AAA family ATPase [Acrocarpospora macrocephala]